MNNPLPFLNWSLKKAQDTEPDSFARARIGILFTILAFSLLKILIVLGFGAAAGQWLQVWRALAALLVYVAITKVLLYKPAVLTTLANVMLLIGLLVIWSNVFVYAHKINLVTLQFIFMVVLSSFYTLGSRWGVIYSTISMLPVVLFLVFKGNSNIYFGNMPQELASPGYEIIVVLNFISITVCHYLFYRAFHINLQEKEKLNQQLQLSIARATKLAESKSIFLSTISHELRTPLNSVIGITELLLEDKPEERQVENLKILQLSALDLLALINNVLDLNKVDADKLELEMVPIQLVDFMTNICSGLQIKASDKQLRFVLDIDTRLDGVTVVTDPTRLSQVIYNLVGNAIKFTDNGRVTVKLECMNNMQDCIDVRFSIADTGPGIHPDKHEAIFELFTQAESHITRKFGGSGLGLAIVKQVLALFNSSVRLESTPGGGAVFSFIMSFSIAARPVVAKIPVIADQTDLSRLRVLVAEDNEVNRVLIKKQLDRLHVASVIVEDGAMAYDEYVSGNFDAIFMDLHMPVLDGYEATRQIRALEKDDIANVHIIAFTASVNEQQKIFETGFDDYLHKPVNMSDLREKLSKITRQNDVQANA